MVFQRLFRRCRLPAAISLAVCLLFAAAGVVVPVPIVGAPAAGASALALLAPADGSEVEPNNTCATAQNLGAVALPFSIRGSLDPSPEAPDVDYFRLTGPAGARWFAHLEGAATGQGTLSDHNLGWFDSTCSRIDRSGTTLAFAVPADGVVILAVSRFDDSDFVGTRALPAPTW